MRPKHKRLYREVKIGARFARRASACRVKHFVRLARCNKQGAARIGVLADDGWAEVVVVETLLDLAEGTVKTAVLLLAINGRIEFPPHRLLDGPIEDANVSCKVLIF